MSDGNFIKEPESVRVSRDVIAERFRQDAKWGEQNHDPFVWLAVLGEEVGEANQAALKATFGVSFGAKSWRQYREELVHVAAVAIAAIECLDRFGGRPPEHSIDPNAVSDGGNP